MLSAWLRAFALTQLVEMPIYRRAFGCGWLEAFGASAITHPLVFWFSASGVWTAPWVWRAAACELFAWLTEALYFALLGRSRALAWTFVANGASFAFGVLCWASFGMR